MSITSKFNQNFVKMYKDDEVNTELVNQDDLQKVIKYANIALPEMLLEILSEGKEYGFQVKNTGVVVQLISVKNILQADEDYLDFKKDIEKGIVFATDLGDCIYYYAEGKDGVGLYYVDAGVGNYYQDAVKFADTFEEFFLQGKGIDILIEN